MEQAQTVSPSVEVPVDPAAAFRLYTAEINRWWKRDSWYWNDRERARGLRIEPFVGGRFVEVYDEASGEGFEIGRVRVWEPGRGTVRRWATPTPGSGCGRPGPSSWMVCWRWSWPPSASPCWPRPFPST